MDGEVLQIVEGILYKPDGTEVTVLPEDEQYRKAYKEMQFAVFAPLDIWAPDGLYLLKNGRMRPVG